MARWNEKNSYYDKEDKINTSYLSNNQIEQYKKELEVENNELLKKNEIISSKKEDYSFVKYKEDFGDKIQQVDILKNNLERSLSVIDDEVMKGYLLNIENLEILDSDSIDIDNLPKMLFFKINELVYKKNESFVYKLSTIFQSMSNYNVTISLVIKSDGIHNDLYLGIRSLNKDVSTGAIRQIFEQNLLGMFPGVKISSNCSDLLKDSIDTLDFNSISSVSCIADYKSEETVENDKFIQGLEKFIDSMEGEKYTAIFLANSVGKDELKILKKDYESISTQISPFKSIQSNFSINQNKSKADGESRGLTLSKNISETSGENKNYTFGKTDTLGSSKGYQTSESYGTNISISKSESKSVAKGRTETVTDGYNVSYSRGKSVGFGVSMFGMSANVEKNSSFTVGYSHSKAIANSVTNTITHGITNTEGSSQTSTRGENFSTNESKSLQESMSSGTQQSLTTGSQEGINLTDSITYTDTFGSSEGKTLTTENKSIESVLNKLSKHIDRIEDAESIGAWRLSTYFIADTVSVTEMAANIYRSIVSGENTNVEYAAVNTWSNRNNKDKVDKLSKYIKNFVSPLFINYRKDYTNCELIVDSSSMVNSNELAIHLGLPRNSIKGLPVTNRVEFARDVITSNNSKNTIKLGNIYHLGKINKVDVNLDVDSLSMHTLITGSTGSGKSNTVYKLLESLKYRGIKFMVIEPAKGEYKHIFGNDSDVYVFGTNEKYTDIIKINPFKFPKNIHILEHIDKIIEIFNVCWPMYSAMPEILKDAVLKTYEKAGWNLDESINYESENLFPTFKDLLIELENVINSSKYSEEVKSNYVGSLVTRVKSLTNGINSKIFTLNEIDEKILFDENVIVDLSRISSYDTRAFIMGILVMRLTEYRMSSEQMNSPLKHITVLEEAHNILKKTSTSQNMESSNILGKSVEMISNSIAEMRTYGEGFIIADQSPTNLDSSVIKNTNTKIIMKLPDEEDRVLVGKAVGLDDEQIADIFKLEKGLAVVHQNDWVESVLCKVQKYNGYEELYKKVCKIENNYSNIKRDLILLLLKYRVSTPVDIDIEKLRHDIVSLDILIDTKYSILDRLDNEKINKPLYTIEEFDPTLSKIVSEIIGINDMLLFEYCKRTKDMKILYNKIISIIKKEFSDISDNYIDEIGMCLMVDLKNKHPEIIENVKKYITYCRERK